MQVKNNIGFILFLATLFFLIECSTSNRQTDKGKDSIEGVWKYVEDDVLQEVTGMSFFTEKHFAFVVNFKTDSLAAGQKILAYSGTYFMQDSIVTATIQYSHNPAFIGQKLRWIHDVNEGTASYKVLDKAGNVVESGKVKRLE
jgi:hypothetical protein